MKPVGSHAEAPPKKSAATVGTAEESKEEMEAEEEDMQLVMKKLKHY